MDLLCEECNKKFKFEDAVEERWVVFNQIEAKINIITCPHCGDETKALVGTKGTVQMNKKRKRLLEKAKNEMSHKKAMELIKEARDIRDAIRKHQKKIKDQIGFYFE